MHQIILQYSSLESIDLFAFILFSIGEHTRTLPYGTSSCLATKTISLIVQANRHMHCICTCKRMNMCGVCRQKQEMAYCMMHSRKLCEQFSLKLWRIFVDLFTSTSMLCSSVANSSMISITIRTTSFEIYNFFPLINAPPPPPKLNGTQTVDVLLFSICPLRSRANKLKCLNGRNESNQSK